MMRLKKKVVYAQACCCYVFADRVANAPPPSPFVDISGILRVFFYWYVSEIFESRIQKTWNINVKHKIKLKPEQHYTCVSIFNWNSLNVFQILRFIIIHCSYPIYAQILTFKITSFDTFICNSCIIITAQIF